MNTTALEILNRFNPVTLSGMDSVKLMTRSDEKYLCHIAQLPGILEAARKEFRILENQGRRVHGYESLYFDTPGHDMYLMHHNGKLNRFKIRIREYRDTHDFFTEIKFKNNHRITNKVRIPSEPGANFRTKENVQFIREHSPFNPIELVPVLYSSFKRITLINTKIPERVTIDIHPEWWHGEQSASLSRLVIIEVKSTRPSQIDGFGYLLREGRIPPQRFSKYCIGTVLLYPDNKQNRFKMRMLRINRIVNTNEL